MALLFFVRNMKGNLLCQSRKFYFQNVLCTSDDNFTTGTGSNSSKDQDVFQIVKISEMSDRVSEAGANGFVDFSGADITLLHQLLNMLELFGQSKFGIYFDSCWRE